MLVCSNVSRMAIKRLVNQNQVSETMWRKCQSLHQVDAPHDTVTLRSVVTWFSQKVSTMQNGTKTVAGFASVEDSSWTKSVDLEKLSEDEKKNHKMHMDAVQHRQEHYTDPLTGYQVATRYGHLLRGNCCGHCCRHCPYNHVNVPLHERKKRFNSAFYV